MNIRDFAPPALVRLRARSRTRRAATYAEALAACGSGYGDDELAALVLERTKAALALGLDGVNEAQHADTLFAVTTSAALASERPTRVLDFGGSFGLAYHAVRARVPLPLRWAVVEQPCVVQRARELETNRLRFFDRLEDAHLWLGAVDLVHASGVLQYLPAPEDTLAQLCALDPAVFALLRTAFSQGRRVVGIQRSRLRDHGVGPLPAGVRDRTIPYPRTFLPESAVREKLVLRGFRMLAHVRTATPECFTLDAQAVRCGDTFLWIKDSPQQRAY